MRKGDCVTHVFAVTNPGAPYPCVITQISGNDAYVVGNGSGMWVDLAELTASVETADHSAILAKLQSWGVNYA